MVTLNEIKEWCDNWSARSKKGTITPKTATQTAQWFTEVDRQWQACQVFLRDNGGNDGDPKISGRPWTGQIQYIFEDLKNLIEIKIQNDKWADEYFTARLTM